LSDIYILKFDFLKENSLQLCIIR